MTEPETTVLPLFPSVVAQYFTDIEENFLHSVTGKTTFRKIAAEKDMYMSAHVNVLDYYPEEKQFLLSKFDHFKTEILRYPNQKFDVSSSWVTKTIKSKNNHFHVHKNSMYSGVLYLSGDKNSDMTIVFDGTHLRPCSFDLGSPQHHTLLNSKQYEIKINPGHLLFFPSYLLHSIGFYNGATPRYSLAFNLCPVGLTGTADSSTFFMLG